MTLSKAVQYLAIGNLIFLFLLCIELCTSSHVDPVADLQYEWVPMQLRLLKSKIEARHNSSLPEQTPEQTPFWYVGNDPDPSDAPDYDVTGWIKAYPYIVYFNMDYGLDGDYKAILNVQFMAEEKLWAETKDGKMKYRAPCGGRADCSEPLLAANVPCLVEQTDCNFGKPGSPYQDPKVLKTFFLECRGDVVCRRDQKPEDCCLITKTFKGKVLDL